MYQKWDKVLNKNPKILFVVDGVCAVFSSFLFGLVLPKFESLFGVPSSTLTFLASFPVLFVVFDMFAYKGEAKHLRRNLYSIAGLNGFYICLSLFFLWFHQTEITGLGYLYFGFEIAIILAFIYLQLNTAKKRHLDAKSRCLLTIPIAYLLKRQRSFFFFVSFGRFNRCFVFPAQHGEIVH